MNGLSERTNQALDGMLKAWVCLILEEAGVCIYPYLSSHITIIIRVSHTRTCDHDYIDWYLLLYVGMCRW